MTLVQLDVSWQKKKKKKRKKEEEKKFTWIMIIMNKYKINYSFQVFYYTCSFVQLTFCLCACVCVCVCVLGRWLNLITLSCLQTDIYLW